MKKLLTLLILSLAFITNARAQAQTGWISDPAIREYHWFGQYEYLDTHPLRFISKNIHWSGNYLEYIEIAKDWTNEYTQYPVTSFYSWLDHKLRFSVDNTGDWTIDGVDNSAYYTEQYTSDPGSSYQYNHRAYGQGLKNNTYEAKNFYIHNLEAGDEYTVTYYENYGNAATKITGSATGTATVSIPAGAVIRGVEIKLEEYVASDFKVEEVSGAAAAALTSSHDAFLRSQGINDAKFGTLGYKYSFKGPGVLEDKRGAAPYITMKFGNDNDMTFVRALTETQVTWGNQKNVTPKLYKKNGDDQFATEATSTTIDGEEVYVVTSHDNPQAAWDTQFWIGTDEYPLPAGQKIHLKFKYKADASATVQTQTHGAEPGSYITWHCIGDLNFPTDDWVEFDQDINISEGTEWDNTPWSMGGWQSVAFNLNVLADATNYYFKDIELTIPERTETISADNLGAASTIHASNDLNPDHNHLQYRWTFRDADYGQYYGRFDEETIKDRMVGKEWSTFTAHVPENHEANPRSNGEWVNGTNYVYGDEFTTIWPLCGNFFYFFPEVDGLLEIEYYCEGRNEINAFWYKQTAEGRDLYVEDQPKIQFINSQGNNTNSFTDGGNNYKMMVNVEKGGIYYLCSLPTNISHERPIFRLKSYTFIPIFRVAPLYKVVHNSEVNTDATRKVAEIFGGPYTDLDGSDNTTYGRNAYPLTGEFTRNAEPETRVKCLGNVVSADAEVEYENNKQYLSFSNIKFREGNDPVTGEAYNPGGAIVVHVNNKEGQASFVLTIAYDAATAKWDVVDGKDTRIAATAGGKAVKHWDFYSGKGDYITMRDGVVSYNGGDTYTTEMNSGWNLGKYVEDDGTRYATNENAWKGKSKLFKETHKADGLTADWEYDWVDVPNKKEPLFKSIYDMEADNADMIHETAGLVFFTEPNELGIYNEKDYPTAEYQDRFIGLMGGGKLIIPRLKEDDRVVIKMGCFGNVEDKGDSEFEQEAVLWLKNAKDAMGTVIPEETDYIIGGSEPFAEPAKALMYPHGEYHFMVNQDSNSDDTDFTIQLKEGGLLKIYSIDIYRNAANNNADILTENVVTGVEPEMLFTDQDTEAKDAVCYLRYSGWQEKSEFHENGFDQIRGNLGSISASDFQGEEFETQPYWKYTQESAFELGDFGSFRAKMAVKTKDDANTFVTDYAPGCMAVDYLSTMPYPYTWDFTDLVQYGGADEAIADEQGRTDLLADYNGWKVVNGDNTTTGLRNAPETEPGILFANGGQIYADDLMLAEAAGIGLKRSLENADDAKLLNNSVNVTADGLVLNSTTNAFHKLVLPKVTKAAVYVRATPIAGAKFKAEYSTDGESSTGLTAVDVAGSNDKIYVMENAMGENDDPRNVELWLNGMTVKKIGVSEDPKALNKYGWATESRMRIIDPELTSYMTGQPIATYIVTGTSVSDKKVTLTPVDGTANVLDEATDDGQPQAYILHNTAANENVDILNGGFHLFVPDMHDRDLYGLNNDNLKLLQDVTGNLMISKLIPGKLDMYDGEYTNYVLTFMTNQAGWGATDENWADEDTERTSVGFYRVQPAGVTSKGNQGYMHFLTTDVKPGSNGINGFTFVFDGDDINSISNIGINDVEPVYYNLQGQQLNGIPTQRGIYIVKGKKITIK
ncbi:MAG: hypothetical protein J5548_02910 [Prevotella sp.]|nr:hypothetical protein [Prevotella sp.]